MEKALVIGIVILASIFLVSSLYNFYRRLGKKGPLVGCEECTFHLCDSCPNSRIKSGQK